MTYANGNVYDGDWNNDIKEGDGKMTYVNGDVYEGSWEYDVIEGDGKMTYANGDVYEGSWRNDVRDGKGKMTYINKNVYDGEWNNNVRDGKGTMTFENGDVYDGDWDDDGDQGDCVMTYANGDVYEGEWDYGVKEDEGKMTYANGDIYEGTWHLNLREGDGKMTYANGEVYEGNWHNDQPAPETVEAAQVRREIPYEVHRASAKINLDKYLEIISGNQPVPAYGDILQYVKTKFTEYIDAHFDNKEEAKTKLAAILQRLSNARELSGSQRNKDIIGATIDFVFKQPPEFIYFYIHTFIQDCYHAYNAEHGMSCSAGILERFYMLVGDAAFSICPDEETCNATNKDTYIELLKLFGKKVDKNELTQEWANQYLESEELKNMNKEERKQQYINFMKDKYTQLGMLDDITEKIINDEADKIDYVFDTLAFGGSRKYSKTGKKSKKRVDKTNKTRKTKKSRKTKKIYKTRKSRKTRKTF